MNKWMTLAKLNFKKYKAKSKHFSRSLIFSLLLFLTALSLSGGFLHLSQNYKTDDVKLREIAVFPQDGREFDPQISLKVSQLEHVREASQRITADVRDLYTVTVEGSVPLNCIGLLDGSNRRFSFMTQSQIAERQKDPSAKAVISGREFRAADSHKAIIDEQFLMLLGFSKPEDMLGKKVKLSLSDLSFDDIEIVGISDKAYSTADQSDLMNLDEISREAYLENIWPCPFYFSDDLIKDLAQSADVLSVDYENLILLADNTEHVKEISDKVIQLFGYDSNNRIAAIERKAESVRTLGLFVYLISAVILLTALALTANTLILKIRQQRKYIEMILKIGCRKRDIIRIYVLENFMTALRACLIALAAAFFLSAVIDLLYSSLYSSVSSIKHFVFLLPLPPALGASAGIILFIILITYMVTSGQVRRIIKQMD